jgi:N-acetylglucosaminyldiphosphoundecaprenol N-acetyl-beta-D-mannosaminyltransferase
MTQIEAGQVVRLPIWSRFVGTKWDGGQWDWPLGSKVDEKAFSTAGGPAMNHSKLDTVALFGMPIANVTMAEAVARIESFIVSGKPHQVATANLDFARNALRDPFLQRVICECSLVVPDGVPMLWAARVFGMPLRSRVTGVDLIPELAQLSAERGYGIYLLGSSEENSARAAQVLSARYPGVKIVGRHSPPVAPLDKMDHDDLLRRIEAAQPDILLVAFGNPKQEIWAHKHRARIQVPVTIGIGGSLDMIAGSLKRAPLWVQRMQLEWFFRMTQEPARLMPRYAKDAMALMRYLPLGLAALRMQPGTKTDGRLMVEFYGEVRVIEAPQTLSGEVCGAIKRQAEMAAKAGQTLVVDLALTGRIEADGIGCLLEARRIVQAAGQKIWLVAMSNPVRRVLQFSAVADLFRMAPSAAQAIRATNHIPEEPERSSKSYAPTALPTHPGASSIGAAKTNGRYTLQ